MPRWKLVLRPSIHLAAFRCLCRKLSILSFQSRDQLPCFLTKTKEILIEDQSPMPLTAKLHLGYGVVQFLVNRRNFLVVQLFLNWASMESWYLFIIKLRSNFRIPRHSQPLLFPLCGIFWRTRLNTIELILILWNANKWRGILKFSQNCLFIQESVKSRQYQDKRRVSITSVVVFLGIWLVTGQ